MFSLAYHPLVVKDLQNFSKPLQRRIILTLDKKLITNPVEFGKPLRNELKGYYRLKIGDCRIVYRIINDTITVFVLHIGQRKKSIVYEEAKKRK